MKLTIILFIFSTLILTIFALPVVENIEKQNITENVNSNNQENTDDVIDNLEYGRYLKEVVEILESDLEFKKRIQNASIEDIKSGNIAEHLSLVQHHIRTKLDEAKQREMIRLRELVGQKFQKQRLGFGRKNPNGKQINEFLPKHIDSKNAETFGRLDLERLIRHASQDLDEIDQKREKAFKEYQLEKEYQRRKKLSKFNAEEREKLEKVHNENLEKKKLHPSVNHPGSVNQMEEVWEKVDQLEANQFQPKAFFQLHDINSDGFLDQAELEAIMLKEAEKIHDKMPDADPIEKIEEINRMRQHVMKEFDRDNDRMLSFEEFQQGIKGDGAKNDLGWQSIEDKPVFSDQEFQQFSKHFSPMSTPHSLHQTPTPQALPEAAAGKP